MAKTKGIAGMPDLLTVNQAAALMSVIPRRIRALLERNKLPGVNYGHQWLIKRDDLTRYMVESQPRRDEYRARVMVKKAKRRAKSAS